MKHQHLFVAYLPCSSSPAFPSPILFLDTPQEDPCRKQASEIQKCFQAVMQEPPQCCARYPKGRSLICSGFEKEEEEKLTLKLTSK
ncbi:unnamed protein product [Nyctereutes procyonoides]|uniref:(raccoon dog) hypothetical protein n=1 Tax=Nyctereutes procyonoides TaxID=34880 RepID=A0A811Y3D1_NYCPR|nr:unnamed protein product [Nyctereutes procyonoides]